MFVFILLDWEYFLTTFFSVGSVNILTDLYILILLIVPMSRMQLSKRKRIGILGIFFDCISVRKAHPEYSSQQIEWILLLIA